MNQTVSGFSYGCSTGLGYGESGHNTNIFSCFSMFLEPFLNVFCSVEEGEFSH